MEINRREFLGAMSASAAMQDRKLKLGLIGCGWYGMVDVNAAHKVGGVETVALCDIDSAHLEESAAAVEKLQGSRPKTFKKYEDLLAVAELDAVVIATPPHWHALPFLAACRRGLPVYEEKPVAYDVREGRAMVNAQKKAGNIVQVGFQRRNSEAVRQAAEYIRAGNAGKIVQVDVQIHYQAGTPDPTPKAPPATLDWDTWCGPAPKLPYSEAIGHKSWRLEEAYGNGHLVDWGIHWIDSVRMILGLDLPKAVSAAGGLYEYKGKITTPDTLTAHFEFEQCPVVWRHRLWGSIEPSPEMSNGMTFFGEKETVYVTDSRWVVMSRAKGAERRVIEIKDQMDPGVKNVKLWLDAIRAKTEPSCPLEDGYKSTATVQLAMIAYKTGRTIRFDAKTETVPGDPAAAKMLMRPYRAPYRHPSA